MLINMYIVQIILGEFNINEIIMISDSEKFKMATKQMIRYVWYLILASQGNGILMCDTKECVLLLN